MSINEYETYLDVIKSSYLRNGVGESVLDTNTLSVGYLDSISILVDITSNESEQKVFDLNKKPINYLEDLRSKFFEEYLEYKKVSESITIPEWLAERVNKAKDTFSDITISYSERNNLDKVLRKPVVGVVEPSQDLERNEEQGTAKYSSVIFSSVKTYGIDDDGYDIWVLPNISIKFSEDEFKDNQNTSSNVELVEPLYLGTDSVPDRSYEELLRLVTPSDSSITEDFSNTDTPYKPDLVLVDELPALDSVFGEDTLGVLYSEPLYIDEDGYDVWGDSGLGVPATELNSTEFIGTVYGTDSDGFDIWVKDVTTDYLTINQAVEDISEATDYSTTSFVGEVTGKDEDGFDIWHTDSIPTVIESDGAVSTLNLGTFVGEVTGKDEDGFDIWSSISDSIESEDTNNDSPSVEEGGSNISELGLIVSEDNSEDTNPLFNIGSADNFIIEEKNPFLDSSLVEGGFSSIEHSDSSVNTQSGNNNQGTASKGSTDKSSELLEDLKSLDRTTDIVRNTFSRFKV